MNRLSLTFCSVVLLVGCNKSSPAPASLSASSQPAQPGEQTPTTSALDCVGVHGEAAPAGTPTDDILGVRPGTPAKAAQRILACAKGGYTVGPGSASFNVPTIEKGPQPLTGIVAQAPNDSVEAVFIGMPGQEVTERLTRQLSFPTGNQPPFAQAKQSLVNKYGPPAVDTGSQANGSETLRWIYEPSGRSMSPQNPSFSSCQEDNGPTGSFSFNEGCGLTIVGIVNGSADGGATSLGVGIMDQAAAYKALDREKAAIAVLNRPTGAAPTL